MAFHSRSSLDNPNVPLMANSELDCRWHFAPSPGGQDQGPNEAMSELFKKEPFESLVRESIQNSLDAVQNPDEPVHVVFRWKRLIGNNHPGLFPDFINASP